jgi:hypothetical protein
VVGCGGCRDKIKQSHGRSGRRWLPVVRGRGLRCLYLCGSAWAQAGGSSGEAPYPVKQLTASYGAGFTFATLGFLGG